MAKIFVHKPLKRAEARRLSEEPKLAEACPGPSVRLLDVPAHDPEKEARAVERAARREAERHKEQWLDHITGSLDAIVVKPSRVIRWLLDSLADPAIEQTKFLAAAHLLSVMETTGPCLVCGRKAPMGKSSMFILPDSAFPEGMPDLAMVAIICPGCTGWTAKYYLRLMARMSAVEKSDLSGRLWKLMLGENDHKFLAWLQDPPPGDDRKVIRDAIEGGFYDVIMDRLCLTMKGEEDAEARKAVEDAREA